MLANTTIVAIRIIIIITETDIKIMADLKILIN